ncbi:hypothetical protein L226DRAFT_301901 [Lentinus tigrinus ALCF2SS1-7]|uniref:uncharacterized protein n=1 Tax=Lentinus tigrinus ALCF2SS1-7 TaxID=1328758 RepID=UPI0011663A12|nr:hypothetical protein L226DRAFT_301901 [Lentinus tigrinus ALCF2SS1-7]
MEAGAAACTVPTAKWARISCVTMASLTPAAPDFAKAKGVIKVEPRRKEVFYPWHGAYRSASFILIGSESVGVASWPGSGLLSRGSGKGGPGTQQCNWQQKSAPAS